VARDSQHSLPFADAEAKAADWTNDLRLALAAVACDLHLRVFVELVHQAGLRGIGTPPEDWKLYALRKTHRELAAAPLGLCCSPKTVPKIVARARTLGLIKCDESVGASGQGANYYGIDWVGVGRILKRPPRMASADRRAADGRRGMIPPAPFGSVGVRCASSGPPPLTADPPPLTADPPPLTADPYEDYLLNNLSPSSNSGTGPGPDPVPESKFQFNFDWHFRHIPELADARERVIAPLPVSRLAYGPLKVIQAAHLHQRLPLTEWWRRQLSLPQPFTANTEADLLLVLGAAQHAVEKRGAENRVAVFCSTVGRGYKGEWRHAIAFLQEARKQLDQLIDTLSGRGLDLNWPDGALQRGARDQLPAEAVR
jgi:hypothetical protein